MNVDIESIFEEMDRELLRESAPLAETLTKEVDAFVDLLIKRYKDNGSFDEGTRDGGDVSAVIITGILQALSTAIGGWQSHRVRSEECVRVIGQLKEMVARLPLASDRDNIIDEYKETW